MPIITVKGGSWSNTEDQVLMLGVQKYGLYAWDRVATMLNNKSASQAKSRWELHLDPSLNHGPWTAPEDEQLLRLARLWPNAWQSIAEQLAGRTPVMCAQRFDELIGIEKGALISTDHIWEAREHRGDAKDMNARDRQMLDDARGRVSNVTGKKGLRQQRAQQLRETKLLSAIQKARELKAAGVEVGKNPLKRWYVEVDKITRKASHEDLDEEVEDTIEALEREFGVDRLEEELGGGDAADEDRVVGQKAKPFRSMTVEEIRSGTVSAAKKQRLETEKKVASGEAVAVGGPSAKAKLELNLGSGPIHLESQYLSMSQFHRVGVGAGGRTSTTASAPTPHRGSAAPHPPALGAEFARPPPANPVIIDALSKVGTAASGSNAVASVPSAAEIRRWMDKLQLLIPKRREIASAAARGDRGFVPLWRAAKKMKQVQSKKAQPSGIQDDVLFLSRPELGLDEEAQEKIKTMLLQEMEEADPEDVQLDGRQRAAQAAAQELVLAELAPTAPPKHADGSDVRSGRPSASWSRLIQRLAERPSSEAAADGDEDPITPDASFLRHWEELSKSLTVLTQCNDQLRAELHRTHFEQALLWRPLTPVTNLVDAIEANRVAQVVYTKAHALEQVEGTQRLSEIQERRRGH